MVKYTEDENKYKKLEKLYKYLFDNKIGLRPYHLRDEIKMPKASGDLKYRHLGTMEHNICDILAQRMKGRKMSWSISGANNLAKILAEKANKRIYNLIDNICNDVIPKDKLETITEILTLTAADVNRKPKKSKYYPIHQTDIPFADCAITNGRKAIQDFFRQRNFSQLIYR